MAKITKKPRLESIDFLKFLAFLAIFMWHTPDNFGHVASPYFATFAVMFFVGCSGFMMGYNYLEKIANLKFKEFISFWLSKIKKFYPFYILTSIPFFFWSRTTMGMTMAGGFFRTAIFYLLLLQIFWPKDYFAFNSVAWYLSLTVWMYFLTYFTYKIVFKIKDSIKKNIVGILCLLGFELLWTIFVNVVLKNNEYFLYIFIVPRMAEFLVGTLLANIFLIMKNRHYLDKVSVWKGTLIEIIVIIICVVMMQIIWGKIYMIWIVPSAMLLMVFAFAKGKIAKIFSWRPFVWLGQLGMYLFLSHVLIINILKKYNFGFSGVTLDIMMLIVTVVFCGVYQYVMIRIGRKRKKLIKYGRE